MKQRGAPKGGGLFEQGVLGIRSEDLDEKPRAGGPAIEMKVEVVEVLGSDQFAEALS